MLGEITARAGPQRALAIMRFRMQREHQRGDRGLADFQRLHQVEAVLAALQRQIDDREVDGAPGDGGKRGMAVAGLGADGKVGFDVDQGGQPAPHQRMVVDQEDLRLSRRWLRGDCGHGDAPSLAGTRAGRCRRPGSPRRGRPHLKTRADQTRPVVHRIQPHAGAAAGATRNSHTVVADAQACLPIAKTQADADPAASSVRDRVADRLWAMR